MNFKPYFTQNPMALLSLSNDFVGEAILVNMSPVAPGYVGESANSGLRNVSGETTGDMKSRAI